MMRRELHIPTDAIVVLSAAAIKRSHKRIDYLLREFAALRSRRPDLPVWLIVAGGWERETDELVKWGQELLGERVRFLVRFPRERMADLYRTADVFTLASLKEMIGIVLLEAAASGLPCVVHRHPVLEWVVGPGGAAIDMTADGALAAELERLACEAKLRGELGRRAREHCIANFSCDRVVDQILTYYDFVMSHDQPQRVASQRPAAAPSA